MAKTSLKIGEQAKRRLRAILLDLIDRGMKSGKAMRVLEQQLEQDPLGTLERLNKLLPDDPTPAPAAAQPMSFNLQFLSAVRDVSARPLEVRQELPVLEHRPVEEPTEW